MTAISLHAQLTTQRAAVRLCLPTEISAQLGTTRLLPATVTINGHRVQTTLHKMAGGYMMAVNAQLRRQLGVDAGDTVQVSAEPDTTPRTVELAPDLAAALDAAGHTTTFEALTAFRQTEIVKSINGAKQPQIRLMPAGSAQRRGFQPLLGDSPIEEAADDPNKMVEAAGPLPGAGRDECIKQGGRELAHALHSVLAAEGEQQAQRRLLGVELAAQRTLVGEVVRDDRSETVVHDRACSPSPSATSRKASTATLA